MKHKEESRKKDMMKHTANVQSTVHERSMNDPMRYASDLLRVPVHVYAVKGESGTEIIAGIYVRSSLNGIYLTSRVIDGEVKGKKSLRHVLPDIVIAKDEVLAEIEVG